MSYKFWHQHGTAPIEEYQGDFMRMNHGLIEIVCTRHYVGKQPGDFSSIDDVTAVIALGPGESIRRGEEVQVPTPLEFKDKLAIGSSS